MKNVANATNYLDVDTKELFRIYSKDKDNKDVRNILIERHLYLVNLLAKKYINKGVEYEDLYQVGSLALIYAIDRYDIGKGYEFSSFATPTIIGEIKKYFRDKVWALRVPRRVQELSKKISEAKVALEQENKTHPKVKDIADYIGCSEEEVLEAIPQVNILGHPKQRAGCISIQIDGVHPYDFASMIDKYGVAVRTGSMCAQPIVNKMGLDTVIRISPAFYNTMEEMEKLGEYTEKVIAFFERIKR